MHYATTLAILAFAASSSAVALPNKINADITPSIERRGEYAEFESDVSVPAGCRTATFALAAGGLAGTFWYNAGGVCPASANDDNVNHAQCGLAATLGTVFTLLTGFSVYGLKTEGASTRDLHLDSGAPHVNPDVIEGYTTTLTKAGPELAHMYSDSDEWTHHYVDFADLSDAGNNHSTVLSIHPSGRKRIAADMPQSPEQLERRATKYTAYYSWDNGDTADFTSQDVCQTREAAQDLAEQLYNYGHSANAGHFCANLYVSGIQLTQGDFALVPTGSFSSYDYQC